jgi:hypothetical protein
MRKYVCETLLAILVIYACLVVGALTWLVWTTTGGYARWAVIGFVSVPAFGVCVGLLRRLFTRAHNAPVDTVSE